VEAATLQPNAATNTAPVTVTNKLAEMSAVVAIYNSHHEAEEAIREMQKAGFDMQRLSIVGKDYYTQEEVVGYYTTGDRMKAWGKSGAFWGGIWGLLFGSAFFVIPGIGPILAAGPLVSWIVGALEGAAVVGGFSALGAGLFSMGVPKDSVIEYETQIKAGKFVVLAHGSLADVDKAQTAFATTQNEGVQKHDCCA
jgi:hypothetical protein